MNITHFIDLPDGIIEMIEYAGGLYLPEVDKIHVYIEKFGNFTLREFETEEEMFNYVR